MRPRHRVPTVFSLYMLDVFCCALGCVILMWLVKDREARTKAHLAGETNTLLAQTRDRLSAASRQAAELQAALDAARAEASATVSDRDRARSDLAAARERLTKTETALEDAEGRVAATADELAKKEKERAKLAKDAAVARMKIADLEVLVRDKEKLQTATLAKVDDLEERLHETEGRLKLLKTTADAVPNLKAEADKLRRAASGASSRVQELEEQLATAQADKRSLAQMVDRVRAAADNRFAGINLTGRRVVFLVDMSGSMKLTDEKTPAPNKWAGVRETLTKIMRSLPDLEKFQVILFSEKVAYPMGGDGEWHDFERPASAEKADRALAAVTPSGNTHMYAGFEEAFRFRAKGLDTIYLLSDGLPNLGPGLSPADEARTIRETDRAEALGKYVRSALRLKWNREEPGQPKVRINSIGFFYESPDVGAFLWALSREHDGSFVGMSKP